MRPLVAVYLVLAVVGLVGTWWFNLTFVASSPGASYLGGWFANPAAFAFPLFLALRERSLAATRQEVRS